MRRRWKKFCDLDELIPTAEFTYNSALGEYLDIYPFEMDIGCNYKSVVDFVTGYES